MKMRKIQIVSIIAIIALVAGYWFVVRDKSTSVTTYTTAPVKRADISNKVTATGTVEPLKQVNVGTQVSGVIQKIYVDFNSVVKKGQLLAELDKTPLLAELASSKADLESAESALTYQEANYTRLKQLFDKNAISETDYETALYQYQNAKAGFLKMTSQLNRAKTNLSYAMIYSPIDGVVLSRAVDEGQTVAASFSTPTLFTIAQDLTKMQVVANVDEADIGQVKEGQNVIFTVDAYPDDNFKGTVKQVRLLSVTNANVVTYSVVIDAPNPELKLKPGLTASIVAYTQEVYNVLSISVKALRFKPDSSLLTRQGSSGNNIPGSKYASGKTAGLQAAPLPQGTRTPEPYESEVKKTIWVKEGSLIHPQEITIGMADETNVEIKSGLKLGELIVLSAEQTKAVTEKDGSNASQSPFMPKRPGSKK
jgi:HlyD family secretion protein